MERTRREEEERLRKPKVHNKACRALLRSRIRCPHCAAFATLRLIDRGPQEKSFFVCGACGEASGPIDITLDRLYARRPGP
jgi:transcription elongation factor Elf1